MKHLYLYKKDEVKFETNGIGVLKDAVDPVISQTINGVYDLSFFYPIKSKLYKEIIHERIVYAKTPKDYQAFRIVSIEKNNEEQRINVYALHISFDLAGNFIEDTYIQNFPCDTAIKHLLSKTVNEHNFIGISDIENKISSRLVRKNVLQALMSDDDNSFLSRIGGEFERDMFKIYWKKNIGVDRGVFIKYRKNLIGLTMKEDYTDVTTTIMPEGFDGLFLPEKYVHSKLKDNYALNNIKLVKFDDVISKEISKENANAIEHVDAIKLLRQKAEEYIETVDKPNITVDVNFLDLAQTVEYQEYRQLEIVYIGDIITIIHEPLNIKLKKEVTSYTYDPILDRYLEITLGSDDDFLTNAINNTNNAVEKINTLKIDIETSLLSKYQKLATDLIAGGFGGFVRYEKDRILIMDSDDIQKAQKVWQFNKNGIGYSKTGINGPYVYAWTMDGVFNTEFLGANSITANHISTDAIKSIVAKFESADIDKLISDEIITKKLTNSSYLNQVIDGVKTEIDSNKVDTQGKIDSLTKSTETKINGIDTKLSRVNENIDGVNRQYQLIENTTNAKYTELKADVESVNSKITSYGKDVQNSISEIRQTSNEFQTVIEKITNAEDITQHHEILKERDRLRGNRFARFGLWTNTTPDEEITAEFNIEDCYNIDTCVISNAKYSGKLKKGFNRVTYTPTITSNYLLLDGGQTKRWRTPAKVSYLKNGYTKNLTGTDTYTKYLDANKTYECRIEVDKACEIIEPISKKLRTGITTFSYTPTNKGGYMKIESPYTWESKYIEKSQKLINFYDEYKEYKLNDVINGDIKIKVEKTGDIAYISLFNSSGSYIGDGVLNGDVYTKNVKDLQTFKIFHKKSGGVIKEVPIKTIDTARTKQLHEIVFDRVYKEGSRIKGSFTYSTNSNQDIIIANNRATGGWDKYTYSKTKNNVINFDITLEHGSKGLDILHVDRKVKTEPKDYKNAFVNTNTVIVNQSAVGKAGYIYYKGEVGEIQGVSNYSRPSVNGFNVRYIPKIESKLYLLYAYKITDIRVYLEGETEPKEISVTDDITVSNVKVFNVTKTTVIISPLNIKSVNVYKKENVKKYSNVNIDVSYIRYQPPDESYYTDNFIDVTPIKVIRTKTLKVPFVKHAELEKTKTQIIQDLNSIRLIAEKGIDTNKIISSINVSPEKIKIKSDKIELTGDTIIKSINGSKTSISGDKIESGTIKGTTLVGSTIRGTEINGATIKGSYFKFGKYGGLYPLDYGMKMYGSYGDSTSGVQVQISSKGNGAAFDYTGLFISRVENLDSHPRALPPSDWYLLRVAGQIVASFKYGSPSGTHVAYGRPVMTNLRRNDPFAFTNADVFSITFMGYCDGDIYFDDGTDGSTHGWFIETNRTQSDRKLKYDIKDCTENAIEFIKKLRFRSFKWKEQEKRQTKAPTKVGLIAQELEQIDSTLVRNQGEYKIIDDFRLLHYGLKAIQELSENNSALELKTKQLEDEINRLKTMISDLMIEIEKIKNNG